MKKSTIYFSVSAISFAVAAALLWVQRSDCAQSGVAGVDIQPTRCALTKHAQALALADKTGNRQAVGPLLDTLNPLMQQIDATATTQAAMRACHLASAHLASGVLAIYEGGRWHSKDRFEAALASCS